MQTPPESPQSKVMSEHHSNGASDISHVKAGASAATQRPGSSQSQRRTPQKLGPRKHSHQSQSGQPTAHTPSANDNQNSGQDAAQSKTLAGTSGGSQPNGANQPHQQTSEQSSQGGRNQSGRRQARRRGRGRSTTQTSESDTGSVSEVAQGGRRNRNRKKSDQSPGTNTQTAQDTPKRGGNPLDTLDEVGETADGAVETQKSTAGGVKKDLEIPSGGTTGSKKKGKGKQEEGKGGKDSTLRLRIDLDLDVELELKAKIQGAVTLALLD